MRLRLSWIFAVCMIGFAGKVWAQSLSGNYARIYSFNTSDGHSPAGPLIETAEKTFLGAVKAGAAGGRGGLYEVSATGIYSLLCFLRTLKTTHCKILNR